MSIVIRILDVSNGMFPCSFKDEFLCDYTDTPDGDGSIVTSKDQTFAKKFDNISEALAFYKQTSTAVPVRPDGLPNRPLTAFTVEMLSPMIVEHDSSQEN